MVMNRISDLFLSFITIDIAFFLYLNYKNSDYEKPHFRFHCNFFFVFLFIDVKKSENLLENLIYWLSDPKQFTVPLTFSTLLSRSFWNHLYKRWLEKALMTKKIEESYLSNLVPFITFYRKPLGFFRYSLNHLWK